MYHPQDLGPRRHGGLASTSRSTPTGTATSCCSRTCSAPTSDDGHAARWRTTLTTALLHAGRWRSSASESGTSSSAALRAARAAGEDAEGGRRPAWASRKATYPGSKSASFSVSAGRCRRSWHEAFNKKTALDRGGGYVPLLFPGQMRYTLPIGIIAFRKGYF